jgi:protein O-GlcNAc transferase
MKKQRPPQAKRAAAPARRPAATSGVVAGLSPADRLFQSAFAEHRTGKLAQAEKLYREALSINPRHPHALNNLAILLKRTRQAGEAEELYRRAIEGSPEDWGPRSNYACLLSETGRDEQAVAVLRTALAVQPDYPDALFNMGNCLRNLKRQSEALAAYERALRARPGMAEAIANKGEIHRENADLATATDCFLAAINARPDLAAPYNNLGETLKEQGRLDEAISIFHKGLEKHPDETPMHSNLLFALNYMPTVPQPLVARAHVHWAEKHADPLTPAAPRFTNDRTPGRRLRIGYVSPDFCTHSCAYFSEPLIEAHDRSQVELYLYPTSHRRDATTRRFQALAQRWTPLTDMTDDQAAAQILADKIDILIDMAGHTCDNRLLTFARKPAPILVSWLGYPNTTGMKAMDYRFTDAVVDPPGAHEAFYAERLVRLPTGFLTFRPVIDAAPRTEPPLLRNGAPTFGSFNNTSKVTGEVIRVWSEILRRTPGSRLIVKSKQMGDAQTRARYLATFAANGVERDRIDLLARIEPVTNHLRAYDMVDVGLDPFPYNGTTTTCEALWMGAPVVTLAGVGHVARVGAGILTHCGLGELVAADEAEYVEKAVALATDPLRLTELRSGMRQRLASSPLTDYVGFARGVEAAYRAMWLDWLAGADGRRV